MANPYQREPRDCVLAAYDRGMQTKQIATAFAVSPAWARRLKQRRSQTGCLPLVAARGRSDWTTAGGRVSSMRLGRSDRLTGNSSVQGWPGDLKTVMASELQQGLAVTSRSLVGPGAFTYDESPNSFRNQEPICLQQ
jgi:transposase